MSVCVHDKERMFRMSVHACLCVHDKERMFRVSVHACLYVCMTRRGCSG